MIVLAYVSRWYFRIVFVGGNQENRLQISLEVGCKQLRSTCNAAVTPIAARTNRRYSQSSSLASTSMTNSPKQLANQHLGEISLLRNQHGEETTTWAKQRRNMVVLPRIPKDLLASFSAAARIHLMSTNQNNRKKEYQGRHWWAGIV
jgi:hypothetical protein